MRLREFYTEMNPDIECSYCHRRYERRVGQSPIWAMDEQGRWWHYCEQQWHPCLPLVGNGDGPDLS